MYERKRSSARRADNSQPKLAIVGSEKSQPSAAQRCQITVSAYWYHFNACQDTRRRAMRRARLSYVSGLRNARLELARALEEAEQSFKAVLQPMHEALQFELLRINSIWWSQQNDSLMEAPDRHLPVNLLYDVPLSEVDYKQIRTRAFDNFETELAHAHTQWQQDREMAKKEYYLSLECAIAEYQAATREIERVYSLAQIHTAWLKLVAANCVATDQTSS